MQGVKAEREGQLGPPTKQVSHHDVLHCVRAVRREHTGARTAHAPRKASRLVDFFRVYEFGAQSIASGCPLCSDSIKQRILTKEVCGSPRARAGCSLINT